MAMGECYDKLVGTRAGGGRPAILQLASPSSRYVTRAKLMWHTCKTSKLMRNEISVHDGDIAPMISALDVINDDQHLPITHIAHDRKWRKSQVSPMGGRIIFELLSCKTSNNDRDPRERFVRLNINDGITALPDCHNGPGKSCPLEEFAQRTKRKGEELQDFRALCRLDDDAAERITFLKQGKYEV